MFGSILSRALAVTICVLALAFAAIAQDLDTVTVSGKVTDTNGAPIVGASVTATMVETSEQRMVTTNEDGRYQIVNLKPGTYKVSAANAGFGTKETQPIVTIAAQKLQQDFSLSPADVKAETTVTVTEDDAPAVDTTRTIVGGTVTQREIEELPVDSRNPLDLVLTLGGTAEEQLSTRDLSDDRGVKGISAPGTTPEEAGIFGLSGGAAYSNNITIDGLDNNDDRGASFRFQPSIDSVREVQVVTNQFSAEYGRASGGRVNISTRGGGNRFRGRAYYYFRDESLNSNTWNNNRRSTLTYPHGIPRPPFQDNNPGGTFGGPIIKNKLFFFSSYEYDNIFDTTVLDAWTPVSGGNPLFPLPAPNDPSAGTVLLRAGTPTLPEVRIGHYLSPTDTPAKRHTFTNRIDWNVNSSQSFVFSHQLGRSNDLRSFSGTNRIADSIIGRVRNTDALNITHNWVANAHLINQVRFQWSRLDPSSAQAAGALSPAVLVSFTPPGENSQTQVFGSTSNSSDRQEKRWQFQDTLSWVRGNMTWRFGGDYQHVDTLFIDRFDTTGTYSFTGSNGFVFFTDNSVSRLQQNFGTNSALLNKYIGFFVQNDWRVKPRLTINMGLRYERETVLDDNNNWGPRIAAAWAPFKDGKGVIRFGAGIFYNRVLLRTVDDYTADSQTFRFDTGSFNRPPGSNPPDSAFWRPFISTLFPNPITLDTVVPFNATQSYTVRELARPSSVFRSLSPDLVIPESYQANVGFEREIKKGLIFETNLTFNKTVHLWRETNPNAPVLPGGLSDNNHDGRLTLTDYLLSITTGPNRFYEGSYNDTVGIHIAEDDNAAACVTNTPTCWINVNSRNSNSSTSCAPIGTVLNTPVCRAFQAVNPLRPYWSVGPNGGPALGAVQLEQVNPIGNSRYVGAVFELRNRYRKFGNGFGGSWRLVYTLSRLMDDGIVNTSDPTTPADFSKDWSRSLADRTHRVSFTASMDMPRWMGKLRLSPLFRWGSSAPFNLSAGGIDRNLDDVSNDRPSFSGDPNDINWRVYASAFPADLESRLSVAPIGSPGLLGRNAGHGPQLWQFNLNVTREFRLRERLRLRPSLEITNPLNMRVFSFGSNFINFDNLSACTRVTPPRTVSEQNTCDAFLAPTRTMTHRRMRLGIRLDF